MNLSAISINRPVFATVLSLVIVLLGLVSYKSLSVREYPNIDEPAVTVNTTYPGASAEIMESQVTRPLEDSLAGIEGIKYISSVSREGTSSINIQFLLTRNPDDAAADVRDRVSRVRGRLPDEVDEPIVAKVQADSDPIIWISMRSDTLTTGQLTTLADKFVQKRLQTIPGVAEARIFGERRYAMRIWLNPTQLAAFQLTPQDIEAVLRTQNVNIPSGRLEGTTRELTILANTDVNTPQQFENLVVSTRNNTQIRLADVATITTGVADDRVNFRINGNNAVALGIVKQATANPLDISTAVNALLPTLTQSLPEGVQLQIANDTSIFIRSSIEKVYATLFEAIVLVGLVTVLFLHSPRAAFIPLVTIPVSLIGAFGFMALFGFSINTLTLLALVLAIGLVVDDAIVVLENIYRHIENGMKPMQAALKGSAEISFAVVAMTLTLTAVYIPVAFMEGRTGKLFTEFALTLAAAVFISGFVALTLSPMLCSLLLKHSKTQHPLAQRIESTLKHVESTYQTTLTRLLPRRKTVLGLLLIPVLGSVLGYMFTPKELAPQEDRGIVFTVFTGPEGATVPYMSAYGLQMEQAIASVPEVERFAVVSGIGGGRLPVANQGVSFVGLKDWAERPRHAQDIQIDLGLKFAQIPGITAFPILPASLGARLSARPIEMVIKDNVPYQQFEANLKPFLEAISKKSGLVGVDTDLKINTPQLNIRFDRAKLADLGITPQSAGRTLEIMLAGARVTSFKHKGEEYDVWLRTANQDRIQPSDLNRITLRSKNGTMVPLANVATLVQTTTPRDLNRFDRARAVTISINNLPFLPLGDALTFLEETAKQTLPATAQIDYKGQSREYKESSGSLAVTFLLAILFIYLVLSAQFESFVDPLIILITVPLSMFGALLCLFITFNSLNIYSQIGLITLIGLITKHGILMVEFANQAMADNPKLTKAQAILQAASLRLRPILMTTAATICGAIPLIISGGAGAESRVQLGWVIVGGMSFGTVLTLFVLPTIYTLLHRTGQTTPKGVKSHA